MQKKFGLHLALIVCTAGIQTTTTRESTYTSQRANPQKNQQNTVLKPSTDESNNQVVQRSPGLVLKKNQRERRLNRARALNKETLVNSFVDNNDYELEGYTNSLHFVKPQTFLF